MRFNNNQFLMNEHTFYAMNSAMSTTYTQNKFKSNNNKKMTITALLQCLLICE